MDQKVIKQYLKSLDQISKFLHSLLHEEKRIIKAPTEEKAKLEEITNLRMLMKSDEWPPAIKEELICDDDETSKLSRAEGIINDLIYTDIQNTNFLDFGCGEGHVSFIAANKHNAKMSVGYDIKEQNWGFEKLDNHILTTNWEDVEKYAPYDSILVNDVFDHSDENFLSKIKQVKQPKGRAYFRFHPWTSRSGTHLYKNLNKAYLHLIFTKQELINLGFKELSTTINLEPPLEKYRNLLKEAGFKVISQMEIKEPVEDFFTKNESILRRIKEKWAESLDPLLSQGIEFPREIIEVQLIDITAI